MTSKKAPSQSTSKTFMQNSRFPAFRDTGILCPSDGLPGLFSAAGDIIMDMSLSESF